jgi:hypothetical protein
MMKGVFRKRALASKGPVLYQIDHEHNGKKAVGKKASGAGAEENPTVRI